MSAPHTQCQPDIDSPYAMTDPIEIIHAYWEGDIGDVEFTELGLDAGMDIEQIGQILQEKRDEDCADGQFGVGA